MTCIIAIKNADGSITLGGDKAASSDYESRVTTMPKIFKVGDFHFGYTTSFYMGQILQYGFSAPVRPVGISDHEYLFIHVRNALTNLFEREKFGVRDEKSIERRFGTFIIIYRGHVYEVQDNMSMLEYTDDVTVVGCGMHCALGAIYSLKQHVPDMSSEQMIRSALRSCSRVLTAVSEECDIIEIPA